MIELNDAPIDATHVLSLVHDPECGAEVMFVGTTRQWTALPMADNTAADNRAAGKPVAGNSVSTNPDRIETSHLVYEAYREMALVQMEKLEAEARRRWPVRRLAMVHRLGRVAASEASVAIAVSCPHRSEAFEAAKWLIDQLKHQVPIWKQEHYVQHGSQWIHPTAGNCNCGSTDQGADRLENMIPTDKPGTAKSAAAKLAADENAALSKGQTTRPIDSDKDYQPSEVSRL